MVKNYVFQTLDGTATLQDLLAGKTAVRDPQHGTGVPPYTLLADGLSAFLPHLEDEFAVVLLSKDPPAVQPAEKDGGWWG